MANAVVLSCVLLLLAVSVTDLTDPTLNGIFFPFGTDLGDGIIPVADDGSSPAISIATGFVFFSVIRNTSYVSLSPCFTLGI